MRASVKTKASAWVVLLAVAGLLFGAAPTLGREDGGLVQAVGEKGSICWTGGRLEAVGVGTPWEKYQSRPQAKPQATEMAHDEAFKNLLEVVGSVRVTSTATVGDLSEQSQVIQAQVRDMMRKAQPLKREYLSDGTVVERLSMPLFGGLPQLVLPREIVQMPEVRQAPSQDPGRGNEAHTGLVVDALGLSVCPALAPRILDPDGREVYGPAYVSRDFAVDQGMCGYANDLEAGREHPRAGKTPLVVRSLSVQGPGRCDLVISSADAAKIREASENMVFLRKCRVVVILDAAGAGCVQAGEAP